MVSLDDIMQVGASGGHTVFIQSDPKWFERGTINELVEFEMALVKACTQTEITLSRFIPYAPYLLSPEPNSAYFAEVFDKLEVSSVMGSNFESWRLNGTAAKFAAHEARLNVNFAPNLDLVFAVPEGDSFLSELRNSSTPMNCVGFSRMDSFSFDPYFKVEFDER